MRTVRNDRFGSVRGAVALAETVDGLRTGRLTRREAMRLLGGTSLAALGLLTLGRRAFAQEGTPPPMVTPQIGPQADGSTLWHVKVGDMKMEELTELHGFLPTEFTVSAGDSIWFDFGMGGFHTVSFLSGGAVPPLFIPDPEAGTPAAGALPKLILNPDILLPAGSDSYDGTAYVNSGIDVFRDPTQPYVLKFTTPGTYDYLCIIHSSVMKGKIVVQEAGTAAPHTQDEYDQMGSDEIAALYEQATAELAKYAEATSTQNADGTTSWAATVGAGGTTQVRIQSFLPKELTIKAGDKVKWVHQAPGEPHTVSFLGEGAEAPQDAFEQFADGRPKLVQSMETFLPQGGNTFSGTGWVNSGFLGIPELGLPMEWECTFDTPGEYIYYCALHGDAAGNGMAAKLTVTA